MNIIVSGAGGHMGREVIKLTEAGYKDMTTVAGVDPAADPTAFSFFCGKSYKELEENGADALKTAGAIVDFSYHGAAGELTAFAIRNKMPLVIATTGQTEEELNIIKDASKQIPIFFASNFSLGVALLVELAKKTAAALPDAEVEIVEVHHDRKIDAPSGTALTLAKAVQEVRPGSKIVTGRSGMAKREPEDIGISSVRIGNVAGIHEVMIGTANQTITLKHEAHSRALFAEGALTAADFIKDKPAGLYDMHSLVE